MDQRLRTEFGLAPKEVRWVTAWSMKPGTTTKNRAPEDGTKEGASKSDESDTPPKEGSTTDPLPGDDSVPLSDPFAEPEHEGAELEPVP